MITEQTEKQERQYLKEVLQKLDRAVLEIDKMIQFQGKQIKESNTHMQEHKRDMDHLEKTQFVRQFPICHCKEARPSKEKRTCYRKTELI